MNHDTNVKPLQRKRLSEAWFSFRIKLFKFNMSPEENFEEIDSKDTESYLEKNLIQWCEYFSQKWIVIHDKTCKIENCLQTG